MTNSCFIRASEVRFLFKVRAAGCDNSGPGVRVEPTPSATAGRKSEAGPPVQKTGSEAARTLTLKVVRVRDLQGRGQSPRPCTGRRQRARCWPRRLQARLIACNMRHSDAPVALRYCRYWGPLEGLANCGAGLTGLPGVEGLPL